MASTLALAGPAGATPDWNLGNTQQSQIANINAQATGPIRNAAVGKCMDDLSGKVTNGSTVDSSACTGAANQNWTFNPAEDYYWDLGFHGTVTPAGTPGVCLDINSTNGGAATAIADGGTVQMLLTDSREVYARSGVALGGWTKESDFGVTAIAVGSDGTQMMVGADGEIYARNSIGVAGWTLETNGWNNGIATNGGVQLYLGEDGTVYARNSIGAATGWTTESAAGSKAISVGSDGTQMMIGSDGSVYARPSIGAASGWTKEQGPGAKAIATNGGVQMMVWSDGYVYAKTGIGNGGWTKETTIPAADPTFTDPISAGPEGTQLIVANDNYAYARKGVGTTAWTKEVGPLYATTYSSPVSVGAGGVQSVIASNRTVEAHTGLSATGWTVETDLTTDTANGRPIQLNTCNGFESQQWLFQHSKTGSIQLYNPTAQRCVDLPNSNTADGTPLQLYTCNGSVAQQWGPPAAPPPPSGPITDAPLGKCAIAGVTAAAPAVADGTKVIVNDCGKGYTPTGATAAGPLLPWTLEPDDTLIAGGRCLEVTGGETATANGTLVEMHTCTGGLNQQWVVNYDTRNLPRLLNPSSGRCLADPGSNKTNGTQLFIYDCLADNSQTFDVPHAGHTFVGPATAATTTVPAGTGDIYAREAAMNTAATIRDTTAHLALLLHAGGSAARVAAAQDLAGPSTALNSPWSTYEDSSWVGAANGPIAQDAAAAAVADQARTQRGDSEQHFLDGYPMYGYSTNPAESPDNDVTNFMSKDSTYWMATEATYADLPVAHADQAAKDKVTAIAAAHAAADPGNAWVWNLYRDETLRGSADDVRRFIQYDGWPTVAPAPGTQEFRVEVESLKARWAGGDASNPLDPNNVLIGAEETAWAEWQAEENAQAQPRADILAAEMQSLDALKAGAETLNDGLGYAWVAGGILWAQGQKAANASGWSGVDMSHATHDLGLVKAKVSALAAAAQNEATVAQDAAAKASTALTTAYATATAAGVPQGRGLTYALQSAQVTKAAAAAAQAESNAMKTALQATNATLADSATLLANASAQAHAARALYLRQTAQDNAAQAQALATQAANQAAAAATAAAKVAADKAQVATTETAAKAALAKADAAAADAATQATIAANAEATAQTQRNNAAAADATAQQQADTAAQKETAAATSDDTARSLNAQAQQAADTAAQRRSDAEAAQEAKNAAAAKAQALAAVAAASQGTDAAAGATAAAHQAQADADAAGSAADAANAAATSAQNAAAAAQAAATRGTAAAEKADSDASTADSAAAQTDALARKADSLAADAIAQATAAADDSAAAQASAAQARTDADNARTAAVAAQTEADGAASDAATATGQALATAQAAQAAAAEAATVAAPANQAIDLAAPYAATDSAAGLASLSSEAAKTMAQQQADVAAAQAVQAAALAAAAQAAANAAAGDAKLAAQAAADAASSAAKAAASAAAAMASAAKAASDAADTQAAARRIDAMDTQAQTDATNAHASASAANVSAAAARAAATAGEADAASAAAAASDAGDSADAAQADATDAANAAAQANTAANTADADAAAAQTAAAQAQAAADAQEAANREAAQQAAANQAASGQPALGQTDVQLLLANCGQTCVDQYNSAQALVGTSLEQFIVNEGGQLVLDFIGVNDVEGCFEHGDVVSCLWTLVDALPFLKLLKAGDVIAKLVELAPKIAKFIEDLKKAKALLTKMAALLETLRKIKDAADAAKVIQGSNCSGPDDDPNPSATNADGNIHYWPMQQFGDGTRCRATGVDGVFTNAMTGVKKSAQRVPAGFDGDSDVANTRGHLMGKQFGGSANNPRNFVAMGAALNNVVMNRVEAAIVTGIKAAADGQTVTYEVVPIYPDGTTAVPSAVTLIANGGGLQINCTLTNEVTPKESGKCS